MLGGFWQRGFFFEKRVFFFNSISVLTIYQLRGVSTVFIHNLFLRFDDLLFLFKKSNMTCFTATHTHINQLDSPLMFSNPTFRLIFIRMILTTFPVFLNIMTQHRLNIWLFFLTKTRKGFYLKLGKPLGRKSRARTFFRKNQTKRVNTEKPSRLKTTTSRWF